MATIEATFDQFGPTVEKEGIVLVDFWAEWCGPCRMFGPIFEAASEKHPDVTFLKVNTEKEQQLAAAAMISSIPTLMAFRDGIAVFRQAGALPAEALEDLISQIRELDMDEVRRQVAEAEANE
ncbi:MAG: thioredoxin [Actinomycetaceae bacterium]|nr:thioredoxin [Actinomycetaceae bacterium]